MSSTHDIPKLDYTLNTPEERTEFVAKICEIADPAQLTPYYLTILANYIFDADKVSTKQNKEILTDNRMQTVNKHETSYQGLVSKMENGEDGLYNLIRENDKNVYLTQRGKEITDKDLEQSPQLRELVENIKAVEAQFKNASGRQRYILKDQLIKMRQDQYVIKASLNQPIYCTNLTKSFSKIDFGENVKITDKGEVVSDGIVTLYDPKHVSILLCNYSALKASTYGKFTSDAYYLMQDLDNLIEKTLKNNHSLYYEIFKCKIVGDQNIEIQEHLEKEFGIKHSVEYISSLWRNKIPKMIAEQAQEDYLLWYYTFKERGAWKKCGRCGEIKLVHNRFFSKNTSSKDGFYSICKECRNAKNKKHREDDK